MHGFVLSPIKKLKTKVKKKKTKENERKNMEKNNNLKNWVEIDWNIKNIYRFIPKKNIINCIINYFLIH